ncbi:MAG: hypothetical protein RIG68_15975 [Imperialibacter sp.]|uniref:hypothetical protein n=1 Tax=Imperialibacter sp. TaxID=2038411 RepID=UPI0032EAECAD
MASYLTTVLKRWKSRMNAARVNAPGVRFKDKTIVIESDDWGAIRTPSVEVLRKFEAAGMDISSSIYRNDALASEQDLDLFFNALQAVRNSQGEAVKVTANTIMANPDFDRIRQDNFGQYHFEPFTTTLEKYPQHGKSFAKWQQAMTSDIFWPQFHGREHLNINRWMKRLQSGDDKVRFCFDQRTTFSGEGDYSFMEAFDWDHRDDIATHREIISDGLDMFEKIFGFRSKSFIAPCYNWDPALDTEFSKLGIEVLQGTRRQLVPTGQFDQYVDKTHFFGEHQSGCPRYNVRNCFFEPTMNPAKDWVDSCLAEISAAFTFQKPAVICSHRVNYIGFIDERNRDRGLKELTRLLKAVVKKWPEVKFMFTDQLADQMAKNNG